MYFHGSPLEDSDDDCSFGSSTFAGRDKSELFLWLMPESECRLQVAEVQNVRNGSRGQDCFFKG